MTWVPGERVESPSLSQSDDGMGPAYELKFLLDGPRARAVEECVRDRLPPDPHGDPSRGGAYSITTLYLDTANLDVFHRTPTFKRRKYRLRRYGSDARIFLERKTRDGDCVRKRRSDVPDDEVVMLANPLSVLTWPGHWFHQKVLERGLRPACVIGYERTAFTAVTAEGPLRVTLDRGLRGRLASTWDVAADDGGLSLLPGQAILEFKFCTVLPTLFKELTQEFGLNPGAASKYRVCMQAWGVSAKRRGVRDA